MNWLKSFRFICFQEIMPAFAADFNIRFHLSFTDSGDVQSEQICCVERHMDERADLYTASFFVSVLLKSLYTTSIPTAIDAGTYYVWYKAVGDDNHVDSEAKRITVTISGGNSSEGDNSGLIEFDKGSEAGSSDISGASLSDDSTDVLKDYAKEKDSGSSLDAKLIVTPQSESAVEKGVVSDIKSQGESIFSGLDVPISSVKFDFLDMSIYTSGDNFATKDKRNDAELNKPLHIVVDYNLSGKHNPVVIRSHAGSSEAFNKLSSLPSAGEYKDATYYVGDNTIHIFTSQFSTYSIAYSTSPVNTANALSPATAESAVPRSDSGSAPRQYVVSGGSSSGGSSSTKEDNLKSGGKGSSKGYFYKNGKGTMAYHSPKAGKKATHLTVPNKVKIGKKTYKVTEVSGYAFVGYDKLKSVTIGKNVKKLDKNAFAGADNLKTIRVKTKKLTAKKVKGSLANSEVSTVAVLKPAHKRYKYYKKIFTKKITGAPKELSVKKVNKNK